MSLNSMTRIAFLGATLAFSLVSHAAIATSDSDPDVRQRVVRYTDLNITHAEGAAVLYARIAHAAREVCGPETSFADLRAVWPSAEFRKCQAEAIARGVETVNAPALTAYYQTKPQSGR